MNTLKGSQTMLRTLPSRCICLRRYPAAPAFMPRSMTTLPNPSSSPRHRPSTTPLLGSLLAVSAAILFAYHTTNSPLFAEEQKKNDAPTMPFTKDQLGVICIIGGPKAGKSTQIQKIVKRFDLQEVKPGDDLKSKLSDIVSKASEGKKPRIVMEGYPSSLDVAERFQKEICPILLYIFIDLEGEEAIKRVTADIDKRDAKINWKRFEDKSAKLIEKFRFQGNILEITGHWPENEVWEQVEAKLESALELDDRGEL